jgi:hypothetical protein
LEAAGQTNLIPIFAFPDYRNDKLTSGPKSQNSICQNIAEKLMNKGATLVFAM